MAIPRVSIDDRQLTPEQLIRVNLVDEYMERKVLEKRSLGLDKDCDIHTFYIPTLNALGATVIVGDDNPDRVTIRRELFRRWETAGWTIVINGLELVIE